METAKNARPEPLEKKTVTIPEASDALGVSKRTIYRMIENGELQTTEHGRIPGKVINFIKKMGGMMTANEVAQLLKVSRSTLYRWHNEGKLPGVVINEGGTVRYLTAEVEHFIEHALRKN